MCRTDPAPLGISVLLKKFPDTVSKPTNRLGDMPVSTNHRRSFLSTAMPYGGTDKLTRRRGLALLDGDCSVRYVDAGAHSERVLRSKDA